MNLTRVEFGRWPICRNGLSIGVAAMVLVSMTGTVSFRVQPAKRISDSSWYLQNREPLRPNPYLELPIGAIQPRGWLKAELEAMARGMTGHLDSLYGQVLGKRNGWLGGNGDVWERGPYWLDGLVPLAYILHDQRLIAKVQPWIRWSLDHQRPDGYFGPVPAAGKLPHEPGLQRNNAQDWWPKMVMLKVLQQYYEATGDKRVITLMTRYFHYQLRQLPKTPLGQWSWWATQRGGDNLLEVYWLYDITGDTSLLRLGDLLYAQTFSWTDAFLHTQGISDRFAFHGVNLAQGLKEPVIYYQRHPENKYPDAVFRAIRDIRRYLGQPEGMYGADEMTHGNNPTQGSEFCSAVEMMFSLENIIRITGDVHSMDLLERITFNALPTQAEQNFSGRQYFQQANQVMISRHPRNFNTHYDGTALCYGLLTGYPCCTVNMSQGWPKYVQHLWFATADRGLAALVYGSSVVHARVGDGARVSFSEVSDYPFSSRIRFVYHGPSRTWFPLGLRIPAWCDTGIILVDHKIWGRFAGAQVVKVNRSWSDSDTLVLDLPMHITLSRWYEDAVAVERGPLVYALKVGEHWKQVRNSDHYGNYDEVFPTTPWNYGLMEVPKSRWQEDFRVVYRKKAGLHPWSGDNAPLVIRARAKIIPYWKLYNDMAGPLPCDPTGLGKEPIREITLIPYGCSVLRISEFPLIR